MVETLSIPRGTPLSSGRWCRRVEGCATIFRRRWYSSRGYPLRWLASGRSWPSVIPYSFSWRPGVQDPKAGGERTQTVSSLDSHCLLYLCDEFSLKLPFSGILTIWLLLFRQSQYGVGALITTTNTVAPTIKSGRLELSQFTKSPATITPELTTTSFEVKIMLACMCDSLLLSLCSR